MCGAQGSWHLGRAPPDIEALGGRSSLSDWPRGPSSESAIFGQPSQGVELRAVSPTRPTVHRPHCSRWQSYSPPSFWQHGFGRDSNIIAFPYCLYFCILFLQSSSVLIKFLNVPRTKSTKTAPACPGNSVRESITMTNLTPKSLRFIPAALGLAFALLANHAGATVTTWDPQGASTQSPYYTGHLDGTWENASWAAGDTGVGQASPVNFVEGDAAEFAVNSGTGTPAFTVTMNANHTVAGIYSGPLADNPCPVTITGPGTMTIPSGFQAFGINNNAGDAGTITINNVMNGTGGVLRQGTGTLVLNGANTYSGGFEIGGGGSATFGNSAAFGIGTITWQVAGFIQPAVAGTAYNIANPMTHGALIETFSGNTGGVTFSGNWTLPATGTTTIENISGTITVTAPISGAAALTINHASTGWSFNGANTFSGALTITAGTLTIGGAGTLGSGTYSKAIANSGTFIYNSSTAQTLSGVISGAGTLTQAGSGTLTLSGANTYTGVTTLSGGILNLNHSETAGTSGPLGKTITAGTLVLSGGTLQYSSGNSYDYSGRFSTAASQAYKIDVNGRTITFATALTSSGGTLTLSDSAPVTGSGLTLTKAATYSGGTTINSGATLTIGTGGALAAAGAIVNNGAFNYNSGAQTLSGVISGTGALTQGAGTLTLSGANTYTGGTTITGGYLYIGSDGNLGGTSSTLPLNCGTLSGGLRAANSLTLSATRGITLGVNGGSIQVTASSTLTIPGVITGTDNFQCGANSSDGTGTNLLSGANNYSGTTVLASGSLRLGANGTLPSGTPLTIGADNISSGGVGAILDLGGFNQTIGPLASSTGIGGIPSPVAIPTIFLTGALTIQQTGNTTFAGQIIGSGGSLTLNGSGTLELSGVNTYTGPTTAPNGAT